jgi:DNA replication and repair protein RecF
VQLGISSRDALAPWTERVAELGRMLVDARREVLRLLEPGFAERAGELGLSDARLAYDAEPPTAEALEARLDRDVDRGATGIGPHLDDVVIASGERDLRRFGSQGEQRLAVLSLLLAEADLLPSPPLVLLDDVLSELDPGRRRILAERVAGMGQTVITATQASALPVAAAQVVEVTPGHAV